MNNEIRNVTGGKVMQCLICNQQDIIVYSEFYSKPMEGCKNRGSVGPMTSCS